GELNESKTDVVYVAIGAIAAAVVVVSAVIVGGVCLCRQRKQCRKKEVKDDMQLRPLPDFSTSCNPKLSPEMKPTISGSEHTQNYHNRQPPVVMVYSEEDERDEKVYEIMSDTVERSLDFSRDCEHYEVPLPRGESHCERYKHPFSRGESDYEPYDVPLPREESALPKDRLNTQNTEPLLGHGEERILTIFVPSFESKYFLKKAQKGKCFYFLK
ncbi:hypothetical protein PoB_007457500, partial [Plakobranchus ocellatus]